MGITQNLHRLKISHQLQQTDLPQVIHQNRNKTQNTTALRWNQGWKFSSKGGIWQSPETHDRAEQTAAPALLSSWIMHFSDQMNS